MANTRTLDVLLCPWCDYVAGVAKGKYGAENARGALVSHLCRKKHSLSRKEAKETAQGQMVMLCEYDRDTYRYLRETARPQPASPDAVDHVVVAVPTVSGATRDA